MKGDEQLIAKRFNENLSGVERLLMLAQATSPQQVERAARLLGGANPGGGEGFGNLLNLALSLFAGAGNVIAPELPRDLLRAAVVMTHAALEDLLRSLMEIRRPALPADFLVGVPLAKFPGETGGNTPPLLTQTKWDHALAILRSYPRDTPVQAIIQRCVALDLQGWSLSAESDLRQSLRGLGVGRREDLLEVYRATLSELVQRRHRIVHSLDRLAGVHRVVPLDRTLVADWLKATREFGGMILAAQTPLLGSGTA